jgi:hypothetical protein
MASIDTDTLHAPRVARRVEISTFAINARWSNIAMQHAKRNIDQSIRKHARDKLQNYMIKLYSKSLRLMKNVQFAFYRCHWIQVKAFSNYAVENLYVMVVLLR